MMEIGILGAGSFGTALAVHVARGGYRAWLWARRRELAEEVASRHENRRYLPDQEVPEGVTATADLADLVRCELVMMAVPSHGFRDVVRDFLRLWPSDRPLSLVSATKGIETESLARMSQVSLEEAVAADRDLRFAVFSGPTFAAELAAGLPTVAVVASEDGDFAQLVQARLSSPVLRLYTSSDVTGVELGGTAKNVIAIAAGVVVGLEWGHNTLAALITRGLHEITRLGLASGGKARTFSGLAGLGDLVLTCTGGLSRNRRAGLALAEGQSLEALERSTGQVAEGVRNSLAVARLAQRRGVEMPITEQMVEVIYEGKSPRQAVLDLMGRELKSEAEL
jgi:glycerol-3-phosphate dehydrogenase (NAD(P)+)